MHNPHDPPPVRPVRRASAIVTLSTLGLAVTSGCALKPPAAPAEVAACVVAAPSPPPAAPPQPKPKPVVVRVIARASYVKPVIPPLPAGVYQSSPTAPRRTALQGRAAEPLTPGKTKDDTKS